MNETVRGIARSVGRARIETCSHCRAGGAHCVSPAQLGGRGLKHDDEACSGWMDVYRPLSWAGAD